ncbi:MAG: trehalase-like domain-containing protein, partial [Vicinamibacterales bacterium]
MPLHHGAIGNGRVLALVGPDTSVDWLCLPRFDSPSVFARILDVDRGGSWAFEGVDHFTAKASYVRNTNVLRTEADTATGRFEILDFAPRALEGESVNAPLEVYRLLRPIEGTPRVRMRFDPRPDYARARVEMVPTASSLEVVGGPTRLFLGSNLPLQYVEYGSPFRIDQPIYFALSCG